MGHAVTIISEAGLNHGGVLKRALQLVDVAKQAGADIVKFQTFDCAHLLRRNDPDRETLAPLQLTHGEFVQLVKHCDDSDIEFLSTPGDLDSLKFLTEEIGVQRIKIGSDDLTNTALLKQAASTNLPIILSTGMATVIEINTAVKEIYDSRPHLRTGLCVTLLHCVSLYPCPIAKANLGAISHLQRLFGVPVGSSDHTKMALACCMAVTLGARMVEAHLMLRNNDPAIDALVSYDPGGFGGLCKAIRAVEELMGDGQKAPSKEELVAAVKYRKGSDGFRGYVQ
jgi:N,N'-diacetyllegionaminate synthase